MSIFKVDDKVYNHNYGWATVIENGSYSYLCLAENGETFEIQAKIDLSFTEYTISGFSQERLIELPEIGELCLFSNNEVNWSIGEFNGIGVTNRLFFTKGDGSFKYFKRVKFL